MADHSLVLTDSATVRCVVCEASTSASGLTPADVVFLEESHCAAVQEQIDVQPLFDAITSLNQGDRAPMVRAVLGLPEVCAVIGDLEQAARSGDFGKGLDSLVEAFHDLAGEDPGAPE